MDKERIEQLEKELAASKNEAILWKKEAEAAYAYNKNCNKWWEFKLERAVAEAKNQQFLLDRVGNKFNYSDDVCINLNDFSPCTEYFADTEEIIKRGRKSSSLWKRMAKALFARNKIQIRLHEQELEKFDKSIYQQVILFGDLDLLCRHLIRNSGNMTYNNDLSAIRCNFYKAVIPENILDIHKVRQWAFLWKQKAKNLFQCIKYLEDMAEIYQEECRQAWNNFYKLEAAINNLITEEFLKGVEVEAAHQRNRWKETDPYKTDVDWFWLIGYLAGKALSTESDLDKKKHRIIALAAAAANWFKSLNETLNESPNGENK